MIKRTVTVMLALLPFAAGAYEAGEKVFRFGPAYVSPNDDSNGVLGDNGLSLIAGNDGVSVDSAWSVGLELSWLFSDQWGFGILGALPFEHDVSGTGSLGGLNVGSVKHLPPTVALQYYFNTHNSGWQPYVGLGVNYTYIYDEEVTPAAVSAVNGILGGSNTVDLDADSSVGLAFQVGVDFPISDRWALNTTLWYVDIDSDVDVRINGATATTIDLEIDPWVFMIGGSYRF